MFNKKYPNSKIILKNYKMINLVKVFLGML